MLSSGTSGRPHSDSESLNYRKDRNVASTPAKFYAISKSHSKLCCSTSSNVPFEEAIGDAESKMHKSYSARPRLGCDGDVISQLRPPNPLFCDSSGATTVHKPGETTLKVGEVNLSVKSMEYHSQNNLSYSLRPGETFPGKLKINLTDTKFGMRNNSYLHQTKYSKELDSVSSGEGLAEEEVRLTKNKQTNESNAKEVFPTTVYDSRQSSNCCQLKKNGQNASTSGELQNETSVCRSEVKEEVRTEGTEAKAFVSDEVSAAERQILGTYMTETTSLLAWKESQRKENIEDCILRPDKAFFTKMDSSLKKNTAFVKKVKSFSSEHLDILMNDLSKLNLAKYLSEVATALVQVKLKVSDITPAVKLSNALHHLYADFSLYLFESWQKSLPLKDEGKFIGQKLLNVDLKFYVELINIGILPYEEAFPMLVTVLAKIISADKNEYNHICALVSFYRHCIEGYSTPRKIQALAKKYSVILPTKTLLLPKEIDVLKDLMKDYFECLVDHIFKERNELFIFQKQNKRILQTRGELSSERKGSWESLRASYESLLSGMNLLAEVLGEDAPTFKADFTLSETDITDQQNMPSIWEDAEEQRFYENLTDMRPYASNISGHHRSNKPISANHHSHSEVDLCGDSDDSYAEDTSDFSDEEDKKEFNDYGKCGDTEIKAFLLSLQNCLNCEVVDRLAIEFLTTLYSKANQKRLLKALFYVPRTRLDLLPFHARLVATLNPVIPLLAKDLAKKLKREFKFRVQKKDQINIESKLKAVKYIGEIVKFKIFSKFDALRCLKMLLNDFSPHHIEMCCALLESCGRYLLRNAESQEATNFFLEGLMRKKAVTPLESRYLTMIENAYYYVAPPEVPSTEKLVLSPMQQFIHSLLFQTLSKDTTDEILELLSYVDWEDNEICEFIISCLSAPHLIKYNNISCLASLVAGLTCYEDDISIRVIDAVMEDVRLGMETNLPMYNQSRLAVIKYIGELFKYGVVDSADIFRVLYSLISFGVCLRYPITSTLDPPNNLFRIRMTCLLLETCGPYLRGSVTKKRLEYYLNYFQRYFLFKYEDIYWQSPENPFPVGIRYVFHDTLQTLQPQIHFFASFRQACEAVKKVEAEVVSELPHNAITVLYGVSDLHTESKQLVSLANEFLAQSASVDPLCNEAEDNMLEMGDSYESASAALSSVTPENRINDVQAQYISETKQQTLECVKSLGTEDEEFMSEFNKMVQENMQQHLLEAVKPKQSDIAIPLHHRASLKKVWEQTKGNSPKDKETFDVMLLLRRGNKQDYKQINIPSDSELALKLKRGEEEERAEKEKLKKLILDMNQRQEEEDYQELLSQSQQHVDLSVRKARKFSERVGH